MGNMKLTVWPVGLLHVIAVFHTWVIKAWNASLPGGNAEMMGGCHEVNAVLQLLRSRRSFLVGGHYRESLSRIVEDAAKFLSKDKDRRR